MPDDKPVGGHAGCFVEPAGRASRGARHRSTSPPTTAS